MAHATTKAIELASPKMATLTPCILDDDPEQLDLPGEQVAVLGYEAIPTSDADEALQLIRFGRCRMIFADKHTPGTNGHDFLDQALRCDPGAHVIMMSGDYSLDSALDAIRRGATDFLPKPIDQIRLKRTRDDAADCSSLLRGSDREQRLSGKSMRGLKQKFDAQEGSLLLREKVSPTRSPRSFSRFAGQNPQAPCLNP